MRDPESSGELARQKRVTRLAVSAALVLAVLLGCAGFGLAYMMGQRHPLPAAATAQTEVPLNDHEAPGPHAEPARGEDE